MKPELTTTTSHEPITNIISATLTYLSGNGPLGFHHPPVHLVRPSTHGLIHLAPIGVRYEAETSGPLVVGIPHHLQDNIGCYCFPLQIQLPSTNAGIYTQIMRAHITLHTTQSVSVPHCSKWARRLSSVVSKLRPPMKSFLSCSGSLESRHWK